MSEASDRPPGYLGIDLGGTKMHALVADSQGNVLVRRRAPTPSRGGNERITQALVTFARGIVDESHAAGVPLQGIGIGAPGSIDSAHTIIDASNLGVLNLPIGRILSEELLLPSLVMHDVKAAVLGEATFGAARGLHDVGYLNLGTGVAVGLLLNGRVHQGARGRSGELGHIQVEPNGPVCSCGRRGCLEMMISGPALERRAYDLLRDSSGRSLLAKARDESSQRVPAQRVAEAARSGDALALMLLQENAEYVARAVAALDNVLDLQCVILGGGLSRLGALWVDMVRAAADGFLLDDPRDRLEICTAQLGDDAGALGVVAAIIQEGTRAQMSPESVRA